MTTPSVVVGTATEVKHLADRLNAAQIKVKRLARLESAIVDFFLEVMERSASPTTGEDDSAFAKAKRKDECVKKAEGDPIALLNALRTHLRMQFTNHAQHDYEKQQTIQTLTIRSERTTHDANEEVSKWEAACAKAQQQMHALAQQLTTTHDGHDRTTRQYKRTLEQLNAELHTIRATSESQNEQLTKSQADVDELKRANEILSRDRKRITEELARTGDRLRPSSSSGSLVAPTPSAGVTGLFGSTPAEQQNLKRVLQDYEFKVSKLEAVNDELRLELQRQQQHIASIKQSTQAQHCVKLEKDAKKLHDVLSDKTKKLADHDAELLRTRATLKEREILIQDMKDEYNKLFTAMQKIKQTPTQAQAPKPLARSSSTAHIGIANHRPAGGAKKARDERGAKDTTGSQANANPYLLEHYKAKIEQQEKELERLQTQLRKMIASEYRHKQKNKLFRVERVELHDTCSSLRSELERAVKTTAKAMAHHMPYDIEDTSGRVSAPLQPEEDTSDDDDSDQAARPTSNQLRCTVADVRRLRQRNQFLENRFRSASADAMASPSTENATAVLRPPRSSSGGLRSSSSAAVIPTLSPNTEPSINATTMQALKQVKLSARARPQSAGPRGLLS